MKTEKSIRQSVTLPAPLAAEIRRVAKKRHITMSRALVTLAESGIESEKAAKRRLNTAYRQFMTEQNPERKKQAGDELIRAIFGEDALAEDTVL